MFWASHVVHHSSQFFNLSTALRQTWVPMTYFPFWMPIALLGFPPWMILTMQAVSLIYQFWIHTERIDKLPRWFEFIFNTPSHHRVHHGANDLYLDKQLRRHPDHLGPHVRHLPGRGGAGALRADEEHPLVQPAEGGLPRVPGRLARRARRRQLARPAGLHVRRAGLAARPRASSLDRVFYDHLTGPWWAELSEQVPGLDVIDVHTHIGQNDPDGFKSTGQELRDGLGAIGARGVVFPMQEPDGYPPANDMVIAEAAASDGRLTPFLRLDPEDAPLAEAERALDAGAQGIKLHPRGESFELDHPALADVFALAGERRLPVLVHAGRGIAPLGHHAVDAVRAPPRPEADPGPRVHHRPGLDLARGAPTCPTCSSTPPGGRPATCWRCGRWCRRARSCSPATRPTARPAFAALNNLRCALQAGLSEDQIRLSFGGQTERLLAREEPARRRARDGHGGDRGPAAGPSRTRSWWPPSDRRSRARSRPSCSRWPGWPATWGTARPRRGVRGCSG